MPANSLIAEFNPVKDTINGQTAERVVWTTKALNLAVDAIKKGLPLKTNPFCGKNVQLIKPDLVYRRTAEEVEDWKHCRDDIVYFATKCFLMTPEGLKPCKLRPYQEKYLRHVKANRWSIYLAARQCGKTLSMMSMISVKFEEKTQSIDDMLSKMSYYIGDNIYYLPIYEVYNLYCKQTLIWKCKYHLYKLIYKLENSRQ